MNLGPDKMRSPKRKLMMYYDERDYEIDSEIDEYDDNRWDFRGRETSWLSTVGREEEPLCNVER